MIHTDLHTHTTFSPDGECTMDTMCRSALEKGMTEIAFTEHVEWHPISSFRPDFDRYFAAIAECRSLYDPQGLRVLSGVEIGNPHDYPDEVAALLAEHQFDVTIASLHWLSGQNVQRRQCFANGSATAVYEAYFTELAYMAAMVDAHLPAGTIIAHFDRILLPAALVDARPDLVRLEPVVRYTWEVITATETVLELNTRFLRTSPGWRYELAVMLRWFREVGGRRIVVNSDAHHTKHIGINYPLAMQLLATAGLVETVPSHPLPAALLSQTP